MAEPKLDSPEDFDIAQWAVRFSQYSYHGADDRSKLGLAVSCSIVSFCLQTRYLFPISSYETLVEDLGTSV